MGGLLPVRVSLGHGRVATLQRARLLTAAVEIASELGYDGMSVARVTGRAGVSRRTFYELFTGREDCFLAVFDETVARATVVAREAAAEENGWRARVRAGLSALLGFIGEEPVLGRLVVVNALGAGHGVLERRAQWLETLAGIVDAGRLEVKTGGGPPPLTAEGVVGAVLAVIHARLLEQAHSAGAGSVRSGLSSRGTAASLAGLLNPLMATIVLPYMGQAAAAQELARPAPRTRSALPRVAGDPLEGLGLLANPRAHRARACLPYLAEHPGASNRQVAEAVGIASHTHISTLLARLAELGLASRPPRAPGAQNAWSLTARGLQVTGTLKDAHSLARQRGR